MKETKREEEKIEGNQGDDQQARDGPALRHMAVMEIIPSSGPVYWILEACRPASSGLPVKGAVGLYVLFM